MDKQFSNLFLQVVTNCEVAAEESRDQDNPAAEELREKFGALRDKLTADPNATLTRSEYLQILVGCMIVKNQLLTEILKYQETVQHYSMVVIPRLERIMNETKNDAEAAALAKEIFQTIDNSNV